jgi:hypothetical protein
MRMARLVSAAPPLLLGLQNVGIFWRHYFQDCGFPWDFAQAYYAMTAYVTSALAVGRVPHWMPFQCMGYPLALNLQTGLHYPPLWFFPLFQVPYTLRAAVVLQCLHVLLGALGMYVLARHLCRDRWVALVGALAFQLFGGFYSNAQHVDIVRAFALTPWLLYAASRPEERSRRLLLLPLVVYLLATGGYPGNLIGALVVLPVFLLAQSLRAQHESVTTRAIWSGLASAVTMVALGLGMATVHLAPAWLFRDAMQRHGAVDSLRRATVQFADIPALLVGRPGPVDDIIPRALYITLPLCVALFFLSSAAVRRRWVELVMLGFAALMAAGPASVVWYLLGRVGPPIRFSRFPASDYRAFLAVLLIIMALEGFQSAGQRPAGWRLYLLRAGIALAVLGQALYTCLPLVSGRWVGVGLATSAASIALMAWTRRHRAGFLSLPLCVLVVLMAVDAGRVLPAMGTWRAPAISSLYPSLGWVSHVDGKLAPFSIFSRELPSRPARKEVPNIHAFSWEGYLDGQFMLADKTPCLLGSCEALLGEPRLRAFMKREWLAVEVEDSGAAVQPHPADADLARAVEAPRTPGGIRQEHYGIDEIRYRVTLARPTLVVENEVYFPGWAALLKLPGGDQVVRAISTDKSLRAWKLPSGDYEMVAKYRFPHLALLRAASVASAVLWLALIGVVWRRGMRVLWIPASANPAE